MKCQDFEALIIDLARQTTGDETLRAMAIEHAGSCRRCARRLDDEHALTEFLRLAAEDPAESPSRLETAVFSAFRERRGNPFQQVPDGSCRRPLWLPAWGIAAALAVTVLGTLLFRILVPSQPAGTPVAGRATGETLLPDASPADVRTTAASPVSADRTSDMTENAGFAATQGARGVLKPQEARPSLEISTDFIALTSSAEIASMESGQLVRVLLPRSAVAAYGLPFNRELADKPIAAQVLIGQDGMARAIRFLGDPDGRAVPASFNTTK